MQYHTGEHIKAAREQKQISIDKIAELSGFELSYLSQIESGEIEPPISHLLTLSHVLQTDIASLIFGTEQTLHKEVVTTQSNRVRVNRRSDFIYESLAPYYAYKHMEPFIIEISKQTQKTNEYNSHKGEEFHLVLSGVLKIVVGDETHILNTGDSIYFDSSIRHCMESVTESVKTVSVIYQKESMLQAVPNKCMRKLVLTAKNMEDRSIAVVCPEETEIEAINMALLEGVIKNAYLIGDKKRLPQDLLIYKNQYTYIHIDSASENYHALASAKGVSLIADKTCHMLMKGQLNTSIFVKAVLNKEQGILTGRRLSMVSIFELPDIDRLIFLTDPGINPFLFADNNVSSAIDIINNVIDVAQGLGIKQPRVALLEANEIPSEKIPTTMFEKQLSEMEWKDAYVSGPLSYDLALYEKISKKKGLINHPVSGKADILVAPYLSCSNILYKSWTMTLKSDPASIVVGASVPIIITSRGDNDVTKFLTICASAVYSQYLRSKR